MGEDNLLTTSRSTTADDPFVYRHRAPLVADSWSVDSHRRQQSYPKAAHMQSFLALLQHSRGHGGTPARQTQTTGVTPRKVASPVGVVVEEAPDAGGLTRGPVPFSWPSTAPPSCSTRQRAPSWHDQAH